MNTEQRLELINRTAQWCYDQTGCWSHGRFGEGMSYLLWAIAANDGRPFDSTACPEEFAELVLILKSNPNGLWDELKAIGAIK